MTIERKAKEFQSPPLKFWVTLHWFSVVSVVVGCCRRYFVSSQITIFGSQKWSSPKPQCSVLLERCLFRSLAKGGHFGGEEMKTRELLGRSPAESLLVFSQNCLLFGIYMICLESRVLKIIFCRLCCWLQNKILYIYIYNTCSNHAEQKNIINHNLTLPRFEIFHVLSQGQKK